MTCISKTVGHREKLCKLWDSWIVIIHNYMGSGTGSIPELELELFMSKLGEIGIGFGNCSSGNCSWNWSFWNWNCSSGNWN